MPNKKTLKQNKRSRNRNRKGGFFGWFKSKPKEGGIDCDKTDYTDIRDMENYIRDCECANKSWYNFNGKKRCKKVQDNLNYKNTQEVNNPIDYARENQSNIVDMFTSIYSPVKYNYYKADLRRADKLGEILQSIKLKIVNDPAIIEQFNTYSKKLIEFNKEKLIQELKEYKTLLSDTFEIREKEREYFPKIQKLANMESLLNNNVDEFRPTEYSRPQLYQQPQYQEEEDTPYQPLPTRDADMSYRGYKAQGHFQQPYYSSQGNYIMPQTPVYGYGGKIRKTKKHFNKRSIKGRNSKRRKH
jgi:hypothetical protein